MKKILLISGVLAALVFALLISGAVGADEAVNKVLRQGNSRHSAALYRYALNTYEKGLLDNPENEALNFNAAQTAYVLGEYQKAVEYYEKAEDCAEKYLNAGNIFFRAGESLEDDEQKLQCYLQALQFYYDGIVKYPQDVPLKYNYEALMEKIDVTSEDSEQSEEGEGDDGEEGEEQDGEEQNGEEGEEEQYNQGEEDEDENEEEDLDQEAIERILRMLENQEAENLKNNQEVVDGGDSKNDW